MVETQSTYLFDEMIKAASEVDYDDVADASGFATLIFSVANSLGLIMPKANMQSYEAIKTIRFAKDWLYNIKTRLPHIMAGDAMVLLEPYDFMHRLAERKPISKNLEDEYLFKAFEARIRGDKTVNEYFLFRNFRSKIDFREKKYFDRPLKWYSASLDRWYMNFRRGTSLNGIAIYDRLEIVSILMSENLFMFAGSGQDEFKKKLYDNHCHYLDEMDDLGFLELSALSHFLSRSSKYMSTEQYQDYNEAIIRAQIECPETNRFYRLTLQNNLAILTE